MKTSILLLVPLSLTLLWAEPSVYGEGIAYSTSTEKRRESQVVMMKQQIAQLQQDVEGLRSVVKSLSRELHSRQDSSETASNSKYVTRAELANIVKNNNRVTKISEQKETKQAVTPKKQEPFAETELAKKTEPLAKTEPLEKAASSDLYRRGVKLVRQTRYTMAKKRFTILEERGYKKASTYYYLGEIAYQTKHYADAIEHYKQSAKVNENSSYMDRLLLHTGLSLEARGEEEQAKRFFRAIMDGYPDTSSAKVAKKHL